MKIGNWGLGIRSWGRGRAFWWSAVVGGLLSVLLIAQAAAPRGGAGAAQPQGVPVAFVPVDVYLDSGPAHLGSYQVELTAKNALIVGLEGGESKAFGEAPYYDPAALQGDKIIVASFSTADNLPTGLTRVARLHLMVNGNVPPGELPAMTDKLIVATDGDGKTLDAKLTLRPMQGELR